MFDEIPLPAHIHGTVLTARDVVDGSTLAYPVLWADRTYDQCPRCNQPVNVVEGCPVMLDTGAGQGGQIGEFSQQHGCGEWLAVAWRDLAEGATEEDILAAAAELAQQRQAELAEERRRIETDLRADLTAALARLAEPLDEGESVEDRADEVTTGNEVDPGVYSDGGAWHAWAYGPPGDDPIVVNAEDLAAAVHG